MKLVLNLCYGGFGISDEALEILKRVGYNEWECDRNTFQPLIELIEERGSDFVSGNYSALTIVEIPDEATDYEITEYDGFEGVTYVLDGKLHHA